MLNLGRPNQATSRAQWGGREGSKGTTRQHVAEVKNLPCSEWAGTEEDRRPQNLDPSEGGHHQGRLNVGSRGGCKFPI